MQEVNQQSSGRWLFGIAAVVTAIGTLVGGLAAAGVFSSDDESTGTGSESESRQEEEPLSPNPDNDAEEEQDVDDADDAEQNKDNGGSNDGGEEPDGGGGESVASLLSEVRSGNTFYLVADGGDGRDDDCSSDEDGSAHGDLLLGAAYEIAYVPSQDGFKASGLNHGEAGCPWLFPDTAYSVSGLPDNRLNIWGFDDFEIDPSTGEVRRNGSFVGYIFIPPR